MTALMKLDLGSGQRPYRDFTGIDIGYSSDRVIKADVLAHLKTLPDASVSEIYSRHYLEHIQSEQLIELLAEIDRVLVPNGNIKFIVPHYSNPFFYSDPTHKTFFGVHTFSYFCEKSCMKRGVPKYVSVKNWHLDDVKVNFVSMLKWRIFGKRVPTLANFLNCTVNTRPKLIEIFERYFCGLFSIYEVHFSISKNPSTTKN